MALKPCRECGNQVSTKAVTCPHCGIKSPAARAGIGLRASFMILVIVLVLVIGLASGGSDQQMTRTQRDSTVAAMLQAAATPVRSYEHADMPISTMRSSTPPLTTKDGELRQLKLDFSWSKGGFENVMLVDFTIKNSGSRAVKDLEITCRYFAPSGSEIDRNTRTIYERVPRQGRKHIPGFNMGLIDSQAESSSCEIIDFAFAH